MPAGISSADTLFLLLSSNQAQELQQSNCIRLRLRLRLGLSSLRRSLRRSSYR
eukprot:m.9120 g.9120  ORF g.9120 m.9120 type:complete len:53 (-) comp6211_c1_seq1:262-420(-)